MDFPDLQVIATRIFIISSLEYRLIFYHLHKANNRPEILPVQQMLYYMFVYCAHFYNSPFILLLNKS